MHSLAPSPSAQEVIPMVPATDIGKVCAVVVTFNRVSLLCGCLNSLLLQTRRLDAILVIDNASSDGTRAIIEREFPSVEIVTMPFNAGGAGGFYEGIKRAHTAGFDWIWVMDDDIEVLADTLETMLGYRDIAHFIHVRKMTPEGPPRLGSIMGTFVRHRSAASGRHLIPKWKSMDRSQLRQLRRSADSSERAG